MQTISEEYRKLQQELHENPKYGMASTMFAPLVAQIFRDTGAKTLSDYGAGKKRLLTSLQDLKVEVDEYRPYDPAFPEYGPPQSADMVCCIYVLEHVEPALIDNVLIDLSKIVADLGFLTVHCGAAAKILSDGRNAHLTQKPASWWLPKLCKYFEPIHFQQHALMGKGFWVLVRSKD